MRRAGRAPLSPYLLEATRIWRVALRFRYSRWQLPRFGPADGFVVGDEATRAGLAAYALSARTYSATSLATFAGCPYRFYLRALARVAEREPFSEIDELDARQRGVLFHAVQQRGRGVAAAA